MYREEQKKYPPSQVRYFHNPELLREEMAQFQDQCRRQQVARTTRKLLITVLLLFFANLAVLAWYLLRYQGLLP